MKNKYYIYKDPDIPETDIWCEMTGTDCGDPELQICGEDENGPVTVLNLNLAKACRLEKILSEKFIPFCTNFVQQMGAE